MKIKAHILSVDDQGDIMRVKAQGEPVHSAGWRGLSVYVFPIPTNDRNKKSFYLGRNITIEIKPI